MPVPHRRLLDVPHALQDQPDLQQWGRVQRVSIRKHRPATNKTEGTRVVKRRTRSPTTVHVKRHLIPPPTRPSIKLVGPSTSTGGPAVNEHQEVVLRRDKAMLAGRQKRVSTPMSVFRRTLRLPSRGFKRLLRLPYVLVKLGDAHQRRTPGPRLHRLSVGCQGLVHELGPNTRVFRFLQVRSQKSTCCSSCPFFAQSKRRLDLQQAHRALILRHTGQQCT